MPIPDYSTQWQWAVVALGICFAVVSPICLVYHGTERRFLPFSVSTYGYAILCASVAIFFWDADSSTTPDISKTTRIVIANVLIWTSHGVITWFQSSLLFASRTVRRAPLFVSLIPFGAIAGMMSCVSMELGSAAASLVPQGVAFSTAFLLGNSKSTSASFLGVKVLLFVDAMAPSLVHLVFMLGESNDIAVQLFVVSLLRVLLGMILSFNSWSKNTQTRRNGNSGALSSNVAEVL